MSEQEETQTEELPTAGYEYHVGRSEKDDAYLNPNFVPDKHSAKVFGDKYYELVRLEAVERQLKEFIRELEKNPDYQLRKSVVREILMNHFGEERCIELFEEVQNQ